MKLNTTNFNLFYLFLCSIWAPLQRFYLHVDGGARSLLLLSIIALYLNFKSFIKFKDVFRSPAFLCWSLLVVFSAINSVIKGFHSDWGAFEFFRSNYLRAYFFLVITIIELHKDKYRCLKVLLVAILIYLFMGASHVRVLSGERAMTDELGNMLPLTTIGATFVASMLFCGRKLKGGWITYISIVVLSLYIIVLAATRKSLGAIVIIIIGMVLARGKKNDPKTVFLFLISALLLYFGLDYIMESTLIGERILGSSDKIDVPLVDNQSINNFLMILLGDRAIHYYLVIEIFPLNPITGIGILNFMRITDYDHRIHSEYMTQLCENGLIGLSLLVLFYIMLIWRLFKKKVEGNIIMCLFGLLSVLFLNLTAWTYNMLIVMIIYAIIINEIYTKTKYKI